MEYLKRGCPNSLRGCVWAQVLGCEIIEKDIVTYNELREAVISTDIMLDKLIIKDIELNAANDDQYFIFDDMIYKTMLCFSRDTQVAEMFSCGSANPPKGVLRGRGGLSENQVLYPPSGVIPFHGMSMFCAPFSYVYTDPVQLYFAFRAMYLRFWFRLHQISSHPQSILGLCALFENILQRHEPELWSHFLSIDVQPTRVVFRYLYLHFAFVYNCLFVTDKRQND
ncbi:TBC1 domain family member 19 [Eurytemora carolleeae]|uniref:TBC1 domain family member 19 n=1 Tax=Eurytemora carolleeae TaxID=1294199 RepID=UPI000C78A52F|nr:TBC1 domain family member 19 [Eurytemora carolleeae]|eukprot:XP_023348029.1 TBC1 domain family member 19-like [Eurytemora affinis]